MPIKKIKITDLVPDDRNLNRGNARGKELIETSVGRFGAGRSVLIDKNNRIIAGNKTQEAAIAKGIKDVIVVETDGTKLVAVKRNDVDLDTKDGREMALADNATVKVDLEWDTEQMESIAEDFGIDMDAWDVDLDGMTEDTTEAEEDDFDEDDVRDVDDDRMGFFYRMMGDYLYPSDNEYQIPTLLADNQPVHLELPFAPWGAEARYKKGISTYHFYVDDYRFERLYKDPIALLQSGCRAIVEPNNSIHDQTPFPIALYQIYRKRYLTRYLQECGLQVWIDLNVSPHFEDINRLGIPDGYNAFFTRGVSGWLATTERHYDMAKRISGKDKPNMCVYGGGKDVAEWCQQHDVLHVNEYINERIQQ